MEIIDYLRTSTAHFPICTKIIHFPNCSHLQQLFHNPRILSYISQTSDIQNHKIHNVSTIHSPAKSRLYNTSIGATIIQMSGMSTVGIQNQPGKATKHTRSLPRLMHTALANSTVMSVAVPTCHFEIQEHATQNLIHSGIEQRKIQYGNLIL